MLNPSTMTVAELVSTLKDAGFFVGVCVAGWKARGIVQPLISFFERAQRHMDVTESAVISLQTGMNTLLTNHLPHLQHELESIAGHKSEHIKESLFEIRD